MEAGGVFGLSLCSRSTRPQKEAEGVARPSFLLAEPPR